MRHPFLGLVASFLLAVHGAACADITPQLRRQVEQHAQAMSLSRSVVLHELRTTGFLDDQKTAAMALRTTPGNALAWAALQAEEAMPGAALALLESVARGMAARHVDAIRYEPQLAYLFRSAPPGPIRAPPARTFVFNRLAVGGEAAVARLPPKAQALLAPLARYAVAHPGGVQGLLTGVLKLSAPDALALERRSRTVDDLLASAIGYAVPPPEARYREVLAALIAHSGVAIRHEQVLAMFPDAMRSAEANGTLRAREDAPLSASARQAQLRDEAVIDAVVMAAFGVPGQGPAPARDTFAASGRNSRQAPAPEVGPGSGSATGGGSGGGAPSFNERVANLHAHGPARAGGAAAPPSFRVMRAIGAGRGGGGIVIGATVTYPAVVPASARWDHAASGGVTYAVARVSLSDRSVVYGRPVRHDIALAAHRFVFGDKHSGAPGHQDGAGAVLLSMMNNPTPLLSKQRVTEFLVHPAIADLAIGRELIYCDGAAFLFTDSFTAMIAASNAQQAAGAGTVPASSWLAKVRAREYGTWYRYVDRPVTLQRDGAALHVRASDAAAPHILFEFIRPAETGTGAPVPELAVVVAGLTQASPQFRSLNDFISTVALLRWLRARAVTMDGAVSGVQRHIPVRSVVTAPGYTSFSARSQASILAEDLKSRQSRWQKLVRDKKLNAPDELISAVIRDRQQRPEMANMHALGFSGETILTVVNKEGRPHRSALAVLYAMRHGEDQPEDAILKDYECVIARTSPQCKRQMAKLLDRSPPAYQREPWWPHFKSVWLD